MIVEYSLGGIITIWKISVCIGWHCKLLISAIVSWVRRSILQNCSKVATSSISAANVGKLIHKFQNPHQMGKVERIFANDKLRRKLFAAMTRNSVCDVFSVWVIYYFTVPKFFKIDIPPHQILNLTLTHIFSWNQIVHKISFSLCFWASDPLIERFY